MDCIECFDDAEYRSQALDHAIKANHKGTGADKIIKDAEKFYGFMFPQNGSVAEVTDAAKARAALRPLRKDSDDVFIAPAPVTPSDVEKQDEKERAFLTPTHDEYLDFADRLAEESTSKSGEKQEVDEKKADSVHPFAGGRSIAEIDRDAKPEAVKPAKTKRSVRRGTKKDRIYQHIVSLRQAGREVRPVDLANRLQIDNSTVNKSIKDLSADGLIRKFKHHGRKVEILLPDEPDPEKEKPATAAPKSLGVRAKKLLSELIKMTEANGNSRRDFSYTDIASATKSKGFNTALNALVMGRYVVLIDVSGSQLYRVARNPDGSIYNQPGVFVREDGVKVCPPSHCVGFGIQKGQFEV